MNGVVIAGVVVKQGSHSSSLTHLLYSYEKIYPSVHNG